MIVVFALLFTAVHGVLQESAVPPTECRDWQECRDAALVAASRQEYESFHDLAWRAAQKGKRDDPVLLALVARAQSLSGRPHDALVMLHRLAAKGFVTDAATSDDFGRVRALSGWSELEARTAALDSAGAAELIPPPAVPLPEPTPDAASPAGAPGKESAPEVRPPVPEILPEAAKPALNTAAIVGVADVLRFTTLPFTPAGLAYDGVSNRFVVGNRLERKLTVVGERSGRAANLAGAHSAGFGEITAVEIDPREGDLWVVSTTGDADTHASALHKLQLISGRLLYTIAPEGQGPARFVDVAITPTGTVLVLDSEGRRLFRARPKSRELAPAVSLDTSAPMSVAPASDAVAYVAHESGVIRVDLAAGTFRAVTPGADVELGGLKWIRWYRDSLVGIQRTGTSHRVVRIALSRQGRTATTLAVLDRDLAMEDPTAASLWNDTVYYLSDTPGTTGDGSVEIAVRKVSLK